MGLERRGNRDYFYTAERVNGRVVKRYVGGGAVADLAARRDAIRREIAATAAEDDRLARADAETLANALAPLYVFADSLTDAALTAAGFHRHRRGPWRKRRA